MDIRKKIDFLYKKLNFEKQLIDFEKKSKNIDFRFEKTEIQPCLFDNTQKTNFDSHYIYHPSWAARIISQLKPQVHSDFSSTLHFCSIISAFQKVNFYDFRPAELKLNNLTSSECDLNKLKFKDNSLESVSCMHTIEHIGLGRYGDEINPVADLIAISELKRVTIKNGTLLLVVPVGKPKIVYNAHRIYSYDMVMNMMEGFYLKEFSMVYDNCDFVNNANPKDVINQTYGCGCFWFIKK